MPRLSNACMPVIPSQVKVWLKSAVETIDVSLPGT